MGNFQQLTPKEAKRLKLHPANREVRLHKVKYFYSELVNGNEDCFPPILVEVGTNYVLDGQHRLFAYKKWWENGATSPITVQYVERPEDKLIERITHMNHVGGSWTSTDFFHCKMVQGDEGTKNLSDFACQPERELLHKLVGRGSRQKPVPKIRFTSAILLGKAVSAELKQYGLSNLITPEVLEDGAYTYTTFANIFDSVGWKLCGSTAWLEYAMMGWYRVIHDAPYREYIQQIGMEKLAEIMHDNIEPTLSGKIDDFEKAFKAALYLNMKPCNEIA